MLEIVRTVDSDGKVTIPRRILEAAGYEPFEALCFTANGSFIRVARFDSTYSSTLYTDYLKEYGHEIEQVFFDGDKVTIVNLAHEVGVAQKKSGTPFNMNKMLYEALVDAQYPTMEEFLEKREQGE